MPDQPNRLYFGDCLEVLREDIADESVDLIYLDPPFNSKRLYNAFIGDAQWVAFDDTWRWHEAEDDFHDVARHPGPLTATLEGLRIILGEGASLAYLSYMANRLRECRRVLKPTGTLYLHCDPTMSHYLKVVLDGLLDRDNFRNEIVWHYDGPQRPSRKDFGRKHDIILRYSRDKQYTARASGIRARQVLTKYELSRYRKTNDGRYFYDLPKGDYSEKSMLRLESEGRIYRTSKGTPRIMYFLDEDSKGNIIRDKHLHDVWSDILSLGHSGGRERLGYPTQKPLTLLERIVEASSNPGDVILDPFCGCGTTIHAAQATGRRWIGIDVCVTACQVIEKRLRSHFDSLWDDVEFVGFPKTPSDAQTLASMDKFKFERWAVSLVDGMEANPRNRQRGDGGIDGRGRLAVRKGRFIDMISQAKGGHTNPSDVRDLIGTRQNSKADIGIFTCFEDRVTRGMRDTAASAGRFMDVPAVQIYTIEDFFAGRKPDMPRAA